MRRGNGKGKVKGRMGVDEDLGNGGSERVFWADLGSFGGVLDNKHPCIPFPCALTVTHHSKR